jgi:hypothetical protein
MVGGNSRCQGGQNAQTQRSGVKAVGVRGLYALLNGMLVVFRGQGGAINCGAGTYA